MKKETGGGEAEKQKKVERKTEKGSVDGRKKSLKKHRSGGWGVDREPEKV